MNHFMQFWKVDQANLNYGRRLNHAASAQYERISPGDMLWIVTTRGQRLKLLGRLSVNRIVSQQEAERRLGKDIYQADLHALAVPNTVEPVSEIDIQDLAPRLRFQSVRDRLTFKRANSTDGKQLQRIRTLTPATAKLLAGRWESRSQRGKEPAYQWASHNRILKSLIARSKMNRGGAGFGSPEENKKVERAAIAHVTGNLKQSGWKVKSVEREKCGYDLRCSKGAIEEHIEVKGVRGQDRRGHSL